MPKSKTPPARRADDTDAFVGERIRAGRIMAKLSQTELGERIGVTFQQVQKYEKGTNRISASRMVMIAEALGQTITWFINEDARAVHKGATDDPLTELGQTRDGIRMARAFNAIKNTHKRHAAVHAVEAMGA